MNINTHSRFFTRAWHAQLATQYQFLAVRDLYDGMTLCAYTWRVLWGMFVLAGLTCGLAIIAAVVADFGAWLLAGVVSGFTKPGELAVIALSTLLVVGVIAAIVGALALWFRFGPSRNGFTPKREPMLIERLWEQYRDKVCFRLTFDKEPS